MKSSTAVSGIDYGAIREILVGVGVAAEEALQNFDANMKALNRLAEPQLIQGYTAEQWQEIIEGGYLCEFSGAINGYALGKLYLPPKENVFILAPQYAGGEKEFRHCNPAQIKGVMRPIFVEPVDKEAWCVFFDKHGMPKGQLPASSSQMKYKAGLGLSVPRGITKYIEV